MTNLKKYAPLILAPLLLTACGDDSQKSAERERAPTIYDSKIEALRETEALKQNLDGRAEAIEKSESQWRR
jgi:outer membrane biogenesis lipoprotein LolB